MIIFREDFWKNFGIIHKFQVSWLGLEFHVSDNWWSLGLGVLTRFWPQSRSLGLNYIAVLQPSSTYVFLFRMATL